MNSLPFDPSKLILTTLKAAIAAITILAICAAFGCREMLPPGF